MYNPRLREVKCLDQGHSANYWLSQVYMMPQPELLAHHVIIYSGTQQIIN